MFLKFKELLSIFHFLLSVFSKKQVSFFSVSLCLFTLSTVIWLCLESFTYPSTSMHICIHDHFVILRIFSNQTGIQPRFFW